MDKVIEFKNFEYENNFISADLYTNDKFIMKISDTELHIKGADDTGVILYEYFRKAALIYLGGANYNPSSFNVH
ncbi:MAG: hypothetical protein LW807_07225 [Proteobacteria bacterium]|jgi:hypothetical protein|nr:hypothetical protein [Pseudomonadota bacterium]